jgi:predicted nucleic acid-binding protein
MRCVLPMVEGGGALVLDASVLINFLGSGCVEIILGSLPDRVLMADRTFNEVVKDPSGRMPSPPDRLALVTRGLIAVETLDHAGSALFIDLVSDPDGLDDGESAAIALAVVTGAVPVLDERRARRVFRERFPDRAMQSSAGLFRRLSDSGNLSPEVVRDALFQALKKARMSVVEEELEWVVRTLGTDMVLLCPSLKASARRRSR